MHASSVSPCMVTTSPSDVTGMRHPRNSGWEFRAQQLYCTRTKDKAEVEFAVAYPKYGT